MSVQLSYHFPTDHDSILERLAQIAPQKYIKNRNYLDGDVTLLSPYISRGVISTRQVLEHLIERNLDLKSIRKFVQELAWRDHWQLMWRHLGDKINHDVRQPQQNVHNQHISTALINANTGITAIDEAIKVFFQTGYLHNHVRMYIAAIACNMAGSHWLSPAQWMYHHLLDGDWANNALSWQWVAGTNANKKYIANQDNINKYCHSNQRGTFLDCSYEKLVGMEPPQRLLSLTQLSLQSTLPKGDDLNIDDTLPSLIYNYYNLDPLWHSNIKANRVLLLEPSIFNAYPISDLCLDFALKLSQNIDNIQVYVGEFNNFKKLAQANDIIYKEHPLNRHYQGIQEPRDWMFDVDGEYRSFFQFWKACTQSTDLAL